MADFLVGKLIALDYRPEAGGYGSGGNPVLEFIYFDRFDLSVSAEYETVPIRGRAEPYRFYSQTGARAWSMQLVFHASVDQGDGLSAKDVKLKTNFLEGCQVPIIEQDIIKPPSRVHCIVGNMINSRGIIRDLRIALSAPFDADGYAHHAEASFVFEEEHDTPLSAGDFFNQDGMVVGG